MGKSTTESPATDDDKSGDTSVKLDFGLSSSSLDDKTRALWPYDFDLIYSVTLEKNSLNTAMVITNKDSKAFDFELLMHTYLRVKVYTLPCFPFSFFLQKEERRRRYYCQQVK